MAEYPQYEIKIIYRCNLCNEKHTATARAKGSALAQEIGTGVGKARATCMRIAKKGVVESFLKAHPKAKEIDFDEETLIAEEITAHDEKTIEKEQIGVPVTSQEIVDFFAQIKGALVQEVEKGSEKLTSVEAEELSPLNTGSPSLLMSFDEIYSSAQKALDNMKDEEEKLLERLGVIQSEMKRFEDLLGEKKTE